MKKLYNEKNIKDNMLNTHLKEYDFEVIGTMPTLIGDKYMSDGDTLLPLYSVYDLSYCKVKEPMYIDKAGNLLIPSSNSIFDHYDLWETSTYNDGVCRGQHYEWFFCI